MRFEIEVEDATVPIREEHEVRAFERVLSRQLEELRLRLRQDLGQLLGTSTGDANRNVTKCPRPVVVSPSSEDSTVSKVHLDSHSQQDSRLALACTGNPAGNFDAIVFCDKDKPPPTCSVVREPSPRAEAWTMRQMKPCKSKIFTELDQSSPSSGSSDDEPFGSSIGSLSKTPSCRVQPHDTSASAKAKVGSDASGAQGLDERFEVGSKLRASQFNAMSPGTADVGRVSTSSSFKPVGSIVKSARRLLTIKPQQEWSQKTSLDLGAKSGSCEVFLRRSRHWCKRWVRHPAFDYSICSLIVANAISIGVQTAYAAAHLSSQMPAELRIVELAFCAVFFVELALRVYAHRCAFFYGMRGWEWNIFDFSVLSLQLLEVILEEIVSAVMRSSEDILSQNFSFVRILRLLRLIRVIRLVRILRHIGELRMLVTSIGNSMKSLLWTVVLLVLILYMMSLYFCSLVSDHRITHTEEEAMGRFDQLDRYFGALDVSMLSLFQSISGGNDWDSLASPLRHHIGGWSALFFSFYIAFTLLAVLNVVTGVFVQSVLLSAKTEKDVFMVNNVRDLFQEEVEGGIRGIMGRDVFLSKLDTPQMRAFFRAIDVDETEAEGLFRLMDLDDNGGVDAEEFLSGCMRLRGPARALDLTMLVREVRRLDQQIRLLKSGRGESSGGGRAQIANPRGARISKRSTGL